MTQLETRLSLLVVMWQASRYPTLPRPESRKQDSVNLSSWPDDELQSASAGRSTNADISPASGPASGYSVRSYPWLRPVSIGRGRVILSNAVPVLRGMKSQSEYKCNTEVGR